ncbi:MAG: hypothetical protein AAGJ35_09790 [Myxococcota bacterium]
MLWKYSGLLCFWIMPSCLAIKSHDIRASRVRYLQGIQEIKLPDLCVKAPTSKRLLLIFASRYCTHCHRTMDALQEYRKQLRVWDLKPILLWTDIRNCVKARMAGAHYPRWAFTHISLVEQQRWAIEATPVLYLLESNRPILRIDGSMSKQLMHAAIQQALTRASHKISGRQ